MDKNNGVSATTIIAMEKTPTMARYLCRSSAKLRMVSTGTAIITINETAESEYET